MPDFLIIGGMRCGSTSLYGSLVEHHSRIYPALRKEIYFFDRYFDRGLSWYRAHFPLARELGGGGGKDRGITGEATVQYLWYSQAAERAAEHLPNAKIMAILRNPVDRAYSHYWQQVRRGHETLAFADAVAIEAERLAGAECFGQFSETEAGYNFHHYSYLARGVYVDQMTPWLSCFPPDQVHVIVAEKFFQEFPQSMIPIWEFLGCRKVRVQDCVMRRRNRGNYARMDERLRQELVEFFRPHNARLSRVLDRELDWDR